jgi:hypothetical protein
MNKGFKVQKGPLKRLKGLVSRNKMKFEAF